jgi:hypothetical protein
MFPGIINLALGLTFIFGVTAALSSVLTELIARYLGLRGMYLLGGLRELLDGIDGVTDLNSAIADYDAVKSLVRTGALATVGGDVLPVPAFRTAFDEPAGLSATGALLGSPVLRSQGMTGLISSRDLTVRTSRIGQPQVTSSTGKHTLPKRRSLPSYIPAKSFTRSVIAMIVPDETGPTTMTAVQEGISMLPDSMSTFRESLQTLVANAGGDINTFSASVDQWYDDHMDRVSGWYKRRVARITIVVGAILVLLLNVNAFTIGHTLYNESVVDTTVSTVAAKSASCSGANPQDCLAEIQSRLSTSLPIGWGTVSDCAAPNARCNWFDQRGIFSQHGHSGWQLLIVIFGFLVMIVAISPGARFWFDILGTLGTFRSTGPKPAPPED